MTDENKTIMSVDLEYDWGTKNTENLTTILPKLLDFFDDHKIRATFFVVGNLVKKYGDVIKDISKKHEIGSHSHTHAILGHIEIPEVEKEVSESKKALESLGIKVNGFRSPECIFPFELGGILKKHGYKYDSSLSCSYFPGRYNNYFKKPASYFASGEDLRKEGRDILELPIANFTFLKLPFGFPFLRLFNPLSMLSVKKKYMFYMHPCEFMGVAPGKGDSLMVRKLYGRNRGKSAWNIFENFIEKSESKFISCRDYIKVKYPDLL